MKPDDVAKDNEQHIYHHHDTDGARVSVSFETNSRGTNFSASVSGSRTVKDALALLDEAEKELAIRFKVPTSV